MKLPDWIANLPTWLKIVAILVVVLGILAFGIGGVKAISERPGPTPSPSPTGPDFRSFIPAALVPAARVSMTPLPFRSCLRTSAPGVTTRFIGTGCVLTVTPPGGPLPQPQELRLEMSSGFGTMVMRQTVRGRSPSPDSSSIPRDIRVSVAGDTPVTVELTCLASSCTFDVIEP